MKTLQMKQRGNLYLIENDTSLIYTIEYVQSGSTITITLKNAYHENVLQLSGQRSGFKLFRPNKVSPLVLNMLNQEGVVTPREHTYEWTINDISYTFVCGEIAGSDALIMSDHEDTLGYASKDGIILHEMMYSAELCVFFVYLIVSKDKVQLDQDKFNRAFLQVQS